MAVSEQDKTEVDPHFRKGGQCLLILMGQRFLVTILSVEQDRFLLSFPACDFPIDGMHVDLEFHDEDGYVRYESEVLLGPAEAGDGVVVKRPVHLHFNRHRISWRVPADFRAEVKSHVHPRKHLVPVINISAGGVLFRSANLFDMGETVEIQFTLPEGGAHQLTGQVVHITDANSSRDQAQLYGLRFIGQDPLVTAEIRAYVRRRVRALYFSGQEMHLRRRSDLLGAG